MCHRGCVGDENINGPALAFGKWGTKLYAIPLWYANADGGFFGFGCIPIKIALGWPLGHLGNVKILPAVALSVGSPFKTEQEQYQYGSKLIKNSCHTRLKSKPACHSRSIKRLGASRRLTGRRSRSNSVGFKLEKNYPP